MPGGDGSGPGGMGPMTGRGAGFCAGYSVPGYANPMPGRGVGRGFGGGGWGRRNWFNATGMPGWARAHAGMPAYGAAPGAPTVGFQPYAAHMSPDQELEMLRAQSEYFDSAADNVRKRIEELEKDTQG